MKNLIWLCVWLWTVIVVAPVFGQHNKKYDYIVTIESSYGKIKLRLFDDTPKHKINFINLVESGYYDSTTFYRVLKDYVLQGGDPNSKPQADTLPEGYGSTEYELDAEILGKYKPKRGMVGASRLKDQVNPARKSSGSQFFIMHDDQYAEELVGRYTFFGEVLQGMDVLDQIVKHTPVDRYGFAKDKVYLEFSAKAYKSRKFRRIMQKKYNITTSKQ